MKKIYRPLIKSVNWALAGLLGLLGFSGCNESVEEYGTPWADYTIKGTVVNSVNGEPIEGIKVSTNTVNYIPSEGPAAMYGVIWTPYKELSAVTTNAKGEFKLSDKGMDVNLGPVIITDIDGEKNGSFASDTLFIDFKDAERIGKPNGWYKGEYVSTVKVELKEKK